MINEIGDNTLKKILTIATCFIFTACVEYKTAKPVDVTFSYKQQSGLKGYHPMPVRAFKARMSQKTEITGVPCDVIGSGFKARIRTPAAVNVPVYGLRSKAIYVKCSYDGEELDKSYAAKNITENKAMANGANGGILGAIIVSAVVAARKNKEADEYGYSNIDMIFKKGQAVN